MLNSIELLEIWGVDSAFSKIGTKKLIIFKKKKTIDKIKIINKIIKINWECFLNAFSIYL